MTSELDKRGEALRQIEPYLDEARALHRELPVFMPYIEHYGGVFKPDGEPQCDVAKLDAAGIRAFGCAAGPGLAGLEVGPGEIARVVSDEAMRQRAIEVVQKMLRDAAECPRAKLVRTVADLRPASAEDDSLRFCVLLTRQQQYIDLESVDMLFRMGLRAAHLSGGVFSRGIFEKIFDGKPEPVLSEYGRQVVARMNELGIVLDMAHSSDESVIEIARVSRKPIIDGHTCSRSAVAGSRGLSDEALRAIAGTGGTVGIHFADHMFTSAVYETKYGMNMYGGSPGIHAYHRYALREASDHAGIKRIRDDSARRAAFLKEHGYPVPPLPGTDRIGTLSHMAGHIEHLVNLCGIEHVSLGGDINGITPHSWALGMNHLGELPHLTAELMRRGWKEEALRKFLSENLYRVFSECLPRASAPQMEGRQRS